LWLDVFGELDPADLKNWQAHLKACQGCRKERERLKRLLEETRGTFETQTLSSDEVYLFSRRLSNRIVDNRQGGRRRLTNLLKNPYRLIPTAVIAALVFIVVGWFGLKESDTVLSPTNLATLKKEDRMIAKDMDILKNMEFLIAMDDLQKLVRAVDENGV
jgi:hypothetical protein